MHPFIEKNADWLWRNRADKKIPAPFQAGINLLKIIFIVIIEYKKNLLPLRTNSLTFTVTLSLVPVLAMGTAILKGMGAGGALRKTAYQFVDQITSIPDTNMGYEVPDSKTAGERSRHKDTGKINTQDSYSAQEHLKNAIDRIFDYVDNTNFATIGVIGIAGVFITVISLLSYIEEAMNTIWHTSSSRSIGRKAIDYLAIVIMLPVAINTGFWAMAALQSETFIKIPHQLREIMPLVTLLLKLLPAVFIIVIFAMLYRFLPNTNVRAIPAFTGAIIGGICWMLLQALYIKLQIGVARYNAIYGSFASMPLFLIWVYAGWFIFLVGAQISYAIQMFRYYHPPLPEESPYRDITAAFDIMIMLCRSFRKGETLSLSDLAGRTGMEVEGVYRITEKLKHKEMIREISDNESSDRRFMPSLPCDEIRKEELFHTIFGRGNALYSPGEKLTAAATQAAAQAIQGPVEENL